MAMSGLRELSVIQTPPVDRLAVRTYVAPWDSVVLREALLREYDRGGQSFFVVPRIKDLPDIEEFLRNRVPEIKYVVAHSQMNPTEVKDRMRDRKSTRLNYSHDFASSIPYSVVNKQTRSSTSP